VRHNREYQEYLLRQPARIECDRSPSAPFAGRPAAFPPFPRFPLREQTPMQTKQIPDISVDFMTWLNAELRKRIEADEAARDRGLVNRLKNYFGRPVEAETAEA